MGSVLPDTHRHDGAGSRHDVAGPRGGVTSVERTSTDRRIGEVSISGMSRRATHPAPSYPGPEFAASPRDSGAGDRPDKPALIAVAHGSRDPRSAATVSAVVGDIGARRPDLDVRLAFLDLNTPSVEQVVDAVAAQGHTEAVVVPLLLGSAFHARVDLPGLLANARARHPRLHLTQADVLGADPRLVTALRERVVAAGADPRDERTGIAIAAVGSSSAAANRRTERIGRLFTAGTAWRASVCFATTEPALPEGVSGLRAHGCDRVLVAPWFLAPGLLTDRLCDASPDISHADTIGAHPLLTDVALDRYTAAATPALNLSA